MTNKSVKEIRSFNRFYTGVIGLLNKHILDSSYTLAEVRILYELYYSKDQTSGTLIQTLSIDKGYLSRVLQQFEKKKFLTRERSAEDSRVVNLGLTAKGKKEFEQLDKDIQKDYYIVALTSSREISDINRINSHNAFKAMINKPISTDELTALLSNISKELGVKLR